MTKPLSYCLLITSLIFLACNNIQEKKVEPVNETDLEIEILNTVLPLLVPEYPNEGIPPPNNELSFELWQEKVKLAKIDYRKKCDSLGMTLHVIDSMYAPQCHQMEFKLSRVKLHPLFKSFVDKPVSNKKIDFDRLKNFNNIKLVPVKTFDWVFPDKCIGSLQISSFVFNEDHSLAAFTFEISQGGCIPTGPFHNLVIQKQKGKWVIIEK